MTIDEAAQRTRHRIFQPASDLLVSRLGVNCFAVGRHLLAVDVIASMFYAVEGERLDMSGLAHGRLTWMIVLNSPWWLLLTLLCAHIRRFERSASRTDFRIVHPFFGSDGGLRGSFVAMCLVLALFASEAVGDLLVDLPDWRLVGLGVVHDALTLVCYALAPMFLSCEWRRLPRVRRDRRAAMPQVGVTHGA